MISNNTVSPIEIKPLDTKKVSKKSKNEGNSFKNEMLENEKRMKKKSIDGREAVGTSQNNKSDAPKTKQAEAPASKNRNENKMPAQAQSAGPTVATPTPTATAPVAKEMSAEANLEIMGELQAKGLDTTALKNNDGKFSIAGMQQVQPQLLQTAAVVSEPTIEAAPTTESLLPAIAVNPEQKSSDLLSQDFNQDLSGFNTGSELSSAAQNTLIKENAPNQQAFAAVLDSKLQTPDQVRENNVENIISQARTILKDGGGEMTLKLTPEGMGTVDLKVVSENGQVSVEIMTQDQNVKKMFEDSVFDIRGALESQNLKIDTFKVGVSEHFDQPPGQQNPAQQFAEREFARDFMGQFRNERQGLRQQGIDSILDSRSPMNSRPEGLSPAASVKNTNGRLNIIA
jgi:flagellar hook-length control protein FliK